LSRLFGAEGGRPRLPVTGNPASAVRRTTPKPITKAAVDFQVLSRSALEFGSGAGAAAIALVCTVLCFFCALGFVACDALFPTDVYVLDLCIRVLFLGMGARGKGQRLFPRPSMLKNFARFMTPTCRARERCILSVIAMFRQLSTACLDSSPK